MTGMSFMGNTLQPSLLDTNILVYANNLDAPFHEPCKALVESALAGEFPAYIALQNLMELYAVITDKRRVTRPLSPAKANDLLKLYTSSDNLVVISPTIATFPILADLIKKVSPQAQSVFDLLLVAVMLEHGVSTIYTLNVRHFAGLQSITAINPIQAET